MAPGAASEDMFVPKDKSSTEGEKNKLAGGGGEGGSMRDEFLGEHYFTVEVLLNE